MILENNGVKVEVETAQGEVHFKVLEQSEEATKVLEALGHVRDDETGLTLRSNNKPAYNRKLKRFFLRGKDRDSDNQTVVAMATAGLTPQRMVDGFRRLLGKITMPAGVVRAEHNDEVARCLPGGTTHLRFSYITRDMAVKLDLTGKRHYPEQVRWDAGTVPIRTVNRHYNEHIGQGVDVLNKSMEPDQVIQVGEIVNPHKVTPLQARKARAAMVKMFEDAHNNDYLVAMWRLATAGRGPDFED